jgi:hypothetical protein
VVMMPPGVVVQRWVCGAGLKSAPLNM